MEISHVIDQQHLIDTVSNTQWEPAKLAKTLQQWVNEFSKYASIRIENNAISSSSALLDWVTRQAFAYGIELPKNLSPQDEQTMLQIVKAEWVKPVVWEALDDMGLSRDLKIKLLSWLSDGTLGNLPPTPCAPSVSVLLQMGNPIQADNLSTYADIAGQNYAAHGLLRQVDEKKWLQYLDRFANYEPESEVLSLENFLQDRNLGQWLVLDAFGLPLLETITARLGEWFPAWELESVDFVLSEKKTTTDNFYRSLLKSGQSIQFEKINVIDEMLHKSFLPFDDLCELVSAELAVAIKREKKKFDPSKPLMITTDHGFRIDKSGRKYQHGGASTLERVIPVIRLKA